MRKKFILLTAMALMVSTALGIDSNSNLTEVRAANEQSFTQSSFSSTSGTVISSTDTSLKISFGSAKNSSGTVPAINSDAIRLYQNAKGGSFYIYNIPDTYYISSYDIKWTAQKESTTANLFLLTEEEAKTTTNYTNPLNNESNINRAKKTTTLTDGNSSNFEESNLTANKYKALSIQNSSNTKGRVEINSFSLSIASLGDVYVVSFNTDGGTTVDKQVLGPGEKATKPENPTKADNDGYRYAFDNWYTSSTYEETFDFDVEITEDTVIYAKWTKTQIEVNESFVESVTNARLAFDYNDASVKNVYFDLTSDIYNGSKVAYTTTSTVSQKYFDLSNNEQTINIKSYGVYLENNYTYIQMNSGKGSYIKSVSPFTSSIKSIDLDITAQSPVIYFSNEEIDPNSLPETKITASAGKNHYELPSDKELTYFYYDATKISAVSRLNSLKFNLQDGSNVYRNFTNVQMQFNDSFDYTNAYGLLESGIVVTTDVETFGKLPTGTVGAYTASKGKVYDDELFEMISNNNSYKIFKNTKEKENYNNFTVGINISNDQLATAKDVQLLAVCYVKTSTGYYFNTAKVYSLNDMLREYSSSKETIEYDDGTIVNVSDLAKAFINELGA